MDVEEFGDVVVSSERVFLLESCTDGSRFLLNNGSLIGEGLAARKREKEGGRGRKEVVSFIPFLL